MIDSLTNRDRVLVIAPHPDDESLATGGLIQRATQAGAAVRVVFATNGESNPWPQRWVEKRWRIRESDRIRWGETRRGEAIPALVVLGMEPDALDLLNFPDRGIDVALMRADQAVVSDLCGVLARWAPTLLVVPSAHDLHSDHNALYVLLQFALDRLGMNDLRRLEFVIHARGRRPLPPPLKLELTEEEIAKKREAIRCHSTQMALSQKRFLGYAKPIEAYYEPAPVAKLVNHHPIREAAVDGGALNLTLALDYRLRASSWLLLAAESPTGGSVRWRVSLPKLSGAARIKDAVTGRPVHEATVRFQGLSAAVSIPVSGLEPLSRLFVKLQRPTVFLDDSGWREALLAPGVETPFTVEENGEGNRPMSAGESTVPAGPSACSVAH